MTDLNKVLNIIKNMSDKIEEVRKLYDLSESECVLMIKLMEQIQAMGYSRKLAIKLMKAGTTMLEFTESDVAELSDVILKGK